MEYKDMLQVKIDEAIRTRDLTPIRTCQDMYKDVESINRIYRCIDIVHQKIRERQKLNLENEARLWEIAEEEGLFEVRKPENIIKFPSKRK